MFRIIDAGAALRMWCREVVDAVADQFADEMAPCWVGLDDGDPEALAFGKRCCRAAQPAADCKFDESFTQRACCRDGRPKEVLKFNIDVTSDAAWGPILEGKFDYAISTHILEDVTNPVVLLEMLPRIAKRGLIATPSKFVEFRKGLEPP